MQDNQQRDQQRDQLSLEREFSTLQARNLSDEGFRSFMSGKYTAKLSLYPGKKLMTFKLVNGVPVRLSTITMMDADIDPDGGPEIDVDIDDGNAVHQDTIGQVPLEVGAGVFLWMAKFTMVERYMHEGVWQTRLSLAVRSPHNINQPLVEGKVYLADERKFNQLFN